MTEKIETLIITISRNQADALIAGLETRIVQYQGKRGWFSIVRNWKDVIRKIKREIYESDENRAARRKKVVTNGN
jgi:hypothetical protein